ncbi:MAG: IPT/TIG domain-containing protein [Caldilineaceae bacterium]|nr:IPT/TIG domain-containing protein [Caldilineaceae bacterium]
MEVRLESRFGDPHLAMNASARWSALALVCTLAAGCHEITAVTPSEGCPRSVVTIAGSGFGASQGTSRVGIGGVEATQVVSWSATAIRVAVPDGAVSGDVVVEMNGDVASGGPFVVLAGAQLCRGSLIPGPAEPGYDAALEELAHDYDRGFHAIAAATTGLNQEVTVALDRAEDRELIRAFLQDTDGWDFAAFAGKPITEALSGWAKVAGFTSGVGLAADAYRYGVLRDTGYPQIEVDRARQQLLRGMEALHIAVAITGTPGVIARGYQRTDVPGGVPATTPLFDGDGNPLPPEKNNGTWREDNSGGLYPNYVWEDSCSRDQYQGWATAYGALWEVIRDDATVPQAAKDELQADARALATVLMTVQASGYDLEIQDADGRPTYHAYLNESAFDRLYLPNLPIKDGFFSLMSTGILGALLYTAEDGLLSQRFVDEYLGSRDLDGIVADNVVGIDFGTQTNYSGSNMAFLGMLTAQHWVKPADARANLATALDVHMYHRTGARALDYGALGMALYDIVEAAGVSGASAYATAQAPTNPDAVTKAVAALRSFPEPPFWDEAVENCDADEIAAGHCVGVDGITEIEHKGKDGRNGDLVAAEAIPWAVRPPSNYHWRTDPHKPNGGGDGSRMLPGVDFRWAYWYGRWVH